ncbi:hypothetical protein ACQKFG_04775 [Peribacillus sp. NPDC076916]|uniref:hypothetical protein n=1 Tax=Peribacillus sp. NPDC076916 TaxID=3390608 RepID=UPI003D05DFF7
MPDIGDWIALLGILLTGYFSYRVLRATEATNKLSEATLELNKEIKKQEERMKNEFKLNMRTQLLPGILEKSSQAYKAVADTNYTKIHDKITAGPKKLDIDKEVLSSYFEPHEVQLITNAWTKYENYVNKYYKTSYYYSSDMDNNDGIEKLIEHNGPVIEVFSELENYFKSEHKN